MPRCWTLELCRMKFDLSMYYKILHGFVDIPRDTLFKVRDIRTRSNGLILYKDKFNCNLERYIFRNRCINIWKSLPQNVVCASNLSLFNNSINSLDLDSIIRKASSSTWYTVLRDCFRYSFFYIQLPM